MTKAKSAEKVVQDIRRKTRRRFSAEEKIRIVPLRDCPSLPLGAHASCDSWRGGTSCATEIHVLQEYSSDGGGGCRRADLRPAGGQKRIES